MSTAVAEFQHRPLSPARPTRPTRSGPRVDSRVGAAADAGSASGRPAVRLTRRGRLVVFLGSLALVFGGATWVAAPAVSTGEEHHQVNRTVVVAPGQTLWDIAVEVAPDSDPRVVIADIVELNGLADAGAVRAGQPLHVPAE